MQHSRKELVETIFAAINGTADDEQRQAVEIWATQNEANARLYEKLTDPLYRSGAIAEFYDYDPAIDWNMVVSRGLAKRRKRIMRRLLSYASVLIPIIAIVSLALRNSLPDPTPQPTVIEPGTSKAVLTLADGQTLEMVGDTLNYQVSQAGQSTATSAAAAHTQSQTAETADIFHTLTVPRGGEFFVRLPDGTNVWLNSGSVFRYCVAPEQSVRRVWLEGEAFFDVRKNDTSFEVVVPVGTVSVYGTSFNVKARRDGGDSHVTLVSGSVGMASGGNVMLLSPGEQAMIHPSGQMVKRRVNVMEYAGWKEGLYVFRNRSLRDIMQELSLWYDFTVVFEPERLADIRYSGNLKRYEGINIFMDILQHTGDIRYRIEDKTIVIY